MKATSVIDPRPEVPFECLRGVHPQQNRFDFGVMTLDSRFDSGNLASAEFDGKDTFALRSSPDCAATRQVRPLRSW